VVGGDRPVTVRVPASYDPGKPAPLLIMLHGYGSSGRDSDIYFHLGAAAEERGFLYAYPDGTVDSTGARFWNATDACCDFDRSGVADDAYLDGVITAVQQKLAVDPKRVYLVGHSNGGFMSYRMACVHADQVAAIVSLAGATFATPADCAPSSPVGILQIHGTDDNVIAFKGGTIEGLPGKPMAAYPGAESTVSAWAAYDDCGNSTSVLDEHVDVDMLDLNDAGGAAEASVKRWTSCGPGGAVELWTMSGGNNHAPTISESFPDAVLDFLEAHPKP
jgi:polyhydroxybutyrate depolymerase